MLNGYWEPSSSSYRGFRLWLHECTLVWLIAASPTCNLIRLNTSMYMTNCFVYYVGSDSRLKSQPAQEEASCPNGILVYQYYGPPRPNTVNAPSEPELLKLGTIRTLAWCHNHDFRAKNSSITPRQSINQSASPTKAIGQFEAWIPGSSVGKRGK